MMLATTEPPKHVLQYVYIGGIICFSVGLIVLGSTYLYDCPLAGYIPIYFLVLGVYGLIEQVIYPIIELYSGTRGGDVVETYKIPSFRNLLRSFMIGVFVWGSVKIFEIYKPNYDPVMGSYCNKMLYEFSFWVSVALWSIISCISLCGAVVGLINCWMKKHNIMYKIYNI